MLPIKTRGIIAIGNGNVITLCHIGICEINLNFGFGFDDNVNVISRTDIGLCRTRLSGERHIFSTYCEFAGNKADAIVIGNGFAVPKNQAKSFGQSDFYTERGVIIQFDRNGERGERNFFNSHNHLYNNSLGGVKTVDGVEGYGVLVDGPLGIECNGGTVCTAINVPCDVFGNQQTVDGINVFLTVAPITAKGISLFGGSCKVCGNLGNPRGATVFNVGNGEFRHTVTVCIEHYGVGLSTPVCGEDNILCVNGCRNLILRVIEFGKSVLGRNGSTVGIGQSPTGKYPTLANGVVDNDACIELEAGVFALCKIFFVDNERAINAKVVFYVDSDRLPLRSQTNFVVTVFVFLGCVNGIEVVPLAGGFLILSIFGAKEIFARILTVLRGKKIESIYPLTVFVDLYLPTREGVARAGRNCDLGSVAIQILCGRVIERDGFAIVAVQVKIQGIKNGGVVTVNCVTGCIAFGVVNLFCGIDAVFVTRAYADTIGH